MANKRNRKWRIALIILLVLIVGSGILFKVRWNAWFANSPEDPYTIADRIDRVTITPGADFGTERTVSWLCGEEIKEGKLAYRLLRDSLSEEAWQVLDADGVIVRSRAGQGAYYHATMRELVSGETYDVRLRVGSLEAKTTLVMPHRPDSVMNFVYLGDVQDPDGEMSTGLFEKFRGDTTFNRPDFFALAGDQVEGPTDEYWRVWYDSWQGYTAEMPMIVATGNHEYLKKGFGRELDPRWVPQYNFPDNGPEDFEGRSFYIDAPLARFVVIDSNGINSISDIRSHRAWLKEVLSSSKQPWQIVMYHHAVHCVRARRSHPVMRYIFKPVLVEYGADLVLQGHDHAYSRITTPGAKEGERTTPVYVISCSSPKLYRNGFDDIHDRLGSGLQLYQTVRVTPDSILYTSLRYSGEVYDELVLSRDASSGMITVTDKAKDIPELFLFDHFGSDKKGQKKLAAYQEAINKRLSK
ncbi:metallophosphoesterase [Porphyromonas sp.]|uniref:metallophosphoesterase family protein n=1 Tax=Porphyromonas sp. TaxID=1924944 RepID=UPI0026DAAE03|nr:metallophosphoesterase [Porphyromonas sp.]MDO4770789.1 metallophosphoesterase [Porphyromonas sp.]